MSRRASIQVQAGSAISRPRYQPKENDMAVVRWDPFREVVSLQSRLNSLFQDYGRGPSDSEALSAASFAPPVDIYEDDQKLVLKLEVPGVKQGDLDIQVEGRTLTVRGERKFDSEEKQENFHRVEHRYGTFARSFTLPNSVDAENVKANYDAGVLQLEFAKKAEAKPRQIKIGVGSTTTERKQAEGAKTA
jgi:HSP20 family protein